MRQIECSLKNLSCIKSWVITTGECYITLEKFEKPWKIAKFKVVIDDGLGFTISCFDWFLPEDHDIYKENKRSLRNITVARLIQTLEQFLLCEGTKDTSSSGIIHHVIPKENVTVQNEEEDEEPLVPYRSFIYYREKACNLLLLHTKQCVTCFATVKKNNYSFSKKKVNLNTPAKLNAPISKTNPKRVLLTIQKSRLKCAEFEERCEQLQMELSKGSVQVEAQLSDDLVSIISESKMTPFMNLFWQQQKKLFQKSPRGARFHPMIIR